jgi:hypothetical protein
MGFSLFGSSGSKSTSSLASTSDQRTAVSGNVRTLVSPGAALATPGGGAVSAGTGATVSQSVVNTGMTANDVTQLMASLDADHAQERATITKVVGDATAALRGQYDQVADLLSATKTPDSNTLTKLLPLLLLLAVLWALTR